MWNKGGKMTQEQEKNLHFPQEMTDSNINLNRIVVRETVGVVMVSIVAIVLLVAFLRSQKQLREALEKNRVTP